MPFSLSAASFPQFFCILLVSPGNHKYPSALTDRSRTRWRVSSNTPAVSGYENQVADKIRADLKDLHPVTDNLGDVIVTIGSGAPHRLIVTPIDEPGFVVSDITPDGYLRVQRLPQSGLPPIFNEMYAAQPVRIETATGKWIDGVVAGLSVHLQPGRTNPPKAADVENIYVDIGATNAAEARKAGVDILDPVALNRRLMDLASAELAGASVGDRFGAAALVELLSHTDPTKMKGTLTVSFVVQQRTGARGLQRILTQTQADEMIYVGRLLPGGPIPEMETLHRAPRREPGGGVLVGVLANRRLAPRICHRTKAARRCQQNSFRIRLFREHSSQELSAPAAIPREMGAHRNCYFISRHARRNDRLERFAESNEAARSLHGRFTNRRLSCRQDARLKRFWPTRAPSKRGDPSSTGRSLRRQLPRRRSARRSARPPSPVGQARNGRRRKL